MHTQRYLSRWDTTTAFQKEHELASTAVSVSGLLAHSYTEPIHYKSAGTTNCHCMILYVKRARHNNWAYSLTHVYHRSTVYLIILITLHQIGCHHETCAAVKPRRCGQLLASEWVPCLICFQICTSAKKKEWLRLFLKTSTKILHLAFSSCNIDHETLMLPILTPEARFFGTKSLQKILLMYAELMTLIFLPSFFHILSALNSSGLYLEKQDLGVSHAGAKRRWWILGPSSYFATANAPSLMRH